MIVAVTGASGFIGHSVCEELVNRGHTPLRIDVHYGHDVREEETKREIIFAAPDAIIHLAGVLGTEELFNAPDEAVDVNIKGTLRMLEAASESGAHYVGITMPQVWDNIYQATKACAQRLASAYHRHFKVPVSHVRAYNVFGPHQKVYGVQKIIPTFATRAWAHEPIPIWGTGDQWVDLVYVEDVAKMLVEVIEVGGDDFLVDAGTGEPHTVEAVAAMVNKICNNDVPPVHLPMRKGEHGSGVVAPGDGWSRFNDWHPTFELSDLRKTVEWYKPAP